MKKYRIIFLSTLALATTAILLKYSKSIGGTDQQNPVVIDSFVPDAKTIASIQKENKKPSRRFRQLYSKVSLDTFQLPKPNSRFLKGLENQLTLLQKVEDDKFGDLNIQVEKLEEVVEIFRSAKSMEDITSALDAYQLSGNGSGKVLFTGYYTPIIRASKVQSSTYKFPVSIDKPDQKDYVIKVVYLRDSSDINDINREGNAILAYTDGTRQLAAFNGDYNRVTIKSDFYKNEEDHDLTNDESVATVKSKNVQKLLVTYNTYDQKDGIKPVGVAKIPLTTNYSVAVDRNYIPMGSVLLAEVPILDDNGNVVRHDLRFVLAQDTGEAIKGAAHVDLYMGEGDAAKESIKHMKKYGRLWLLLPKEKPKVLAQNL
jgi:membrane-bound lytic murein transglycosylase A